MLRHAKPFLLLGHVKSFLLLGNAKSNQVSRFRFCSASSLFRYSFDREVDYLQMGSLCEMIESDVNEVKLAATKLANHVYLLGLGFGFGTTFLKFLASAAAIYLLILDRTNWKTNMLTSLLVPYIFLSLPSAVFSLLRGDVGKWIAFVAVVLRLFFPRHFPDWLEMPGSLILLLVVALSFFAYTIRD